MQGYVSNITEGEWIFMTFSVYVGHDTGNNWLDCFMPNFVPPYAPLTKLGEAGLRPSGASCSQIKLQKHHKNYQSRWS